MGLQHLNCYGFAARFAGAFFIALFAGAPAAFFAAGRDAFFALDAFFAADFFRAAIVFLVSAAFSSSRSTLRADFLSLSIS
jgi:hypothetical protein